ncbi:hypothetical protein CYMTET_9485 [Cymbomonas tetramitiformis]|uniref:BPL/LPL catalytic domain-containing protein n=1 Tax=Cymbomonas tetramitiformis TaxID=36881 RepID=A0AAE0GRE2_9CHLO|nr:hypothetical protein CYMTET_9485 [Cymbomonas tetramitiformis]
MEKVQGGASTSGLHLIHLRGKTQFDVDTAKRHLEKVPVEGPFHVVPEAASTENLAKFDVARYFYALQGFRFGHILLSAEHIPSTQTFLYENVKSFPTGITFVADVQGEGKGRGDNAWHSPHGCLMFSHVISIANGSLLPFLQYVVSLAIIEAIQQEAARCLQVPNASEAVDVKIKWPNDIYAPGGKKLGGILCQTVFLDQQFHVVIGVGLNVTNEEPTSCVAAVMRDAAARLQVSHAEVPTRESLLAAIMARLEVLTHTFVKDGFAPLQGAYLANWLHTGQAVKLVESDPATGKEQEVQLQVMGLAPSGYLLAVDRAGKRFELHPDGNRLDFFKGLVRKKL